MKNYGNIYDHICRLGASAILACLIYSLQLVGNTAHADYPGRDGFKCNVSHYYEQAFGYAEQVSEARESACLNHFLGDHREGTTCYMYPYPGAESPTSSKSIGCQSASVCLTGNGYVAADPVYGTCSEPPPEDDDDGDGDNCDAGEEALPDCQCPDGSTRSPGESCPDDGGGDGGDDDCDASDPECDGICTEDNPDDPDCSDEVDASQCKKGEEGLLGPFHFPNGLGIPPQTVCGNDNCVYQYDVEADQPEYVECTPTDPITGENISPYEYCIYPKNGDACKYTGEEFDEIDPEECPVGQSKDDQGNCTEIVDFCEIDEHTNGTEDHQPDGIPDNEGTFACDQSDDENPDDPDEPSSSGDMSCSVPLPDCTDADPIACQALQLEYETTCGVTFNDVFACDQPLQCEGNPIECAQLTLDRKNYCSTVLSEEQRNDPESLSNFQDGIDDGSKYYGNNDGEDGSFIDTSNLLDSLDYSGFGLSRSCIPDQTISLLGSNYTLDFSSWCFIFNLAGAIVVLVGTFISIRIVAGGI